ncbi:hypothetical protein [Niveibacterium sp.]|uniref:hypothetical protein n=1 Tax=Niveibacterium sp. TaxID=2017444 RepID=UPI0035B4A85D
MKRAVRERSIGIEEIDQDDGRNCRKLASNAALGRIERTGPLAGPVRFFRFAFSFEQRGKGDFAVCVDASAAGFVALRVVLHTAFVGDPDHDWSVDVALGEVHQRFHLILGVKCAPWWYPA